MKKTADELMYAVCNWGADPKLIETNEEAEQMADIINSSSIYYEITDKEEFGIAASQLDFSEQVPPRRLYAFVNGSRGVICYSEDYGD